MTLDEALALATRALRRGECSSHRTVNEPCVVCSASDKAIKVLSDFAAHARAEGYAAGVIAERDHTVRACAEREVQRCRAELAERSLATTIHELAVRRCAEN